VYSPYIKNELRRFRGKCPVKDFEIEAFHETVEYNETLYVCYMMDNIVIFFGEILAVLIYLFLFVLLRYCVSLMIIFTNH